MYLFMYSLFFLFLIPILLSSTLGNHSKVFNVTCVFIYVFLAYDILFICYCILLFCMHIFSAVCSMYNCHLMNYAYLTCKFDKFGISHEKITTIKTMNISKIPKTFLGCICNLFLLLPFPDRSQAAFHHHR